jgi:hypothetical protein
MDLVNLPLPINQIIEIQTENWLNGGYIIQLQNEKYVVGKKVIVTK